MPGDKYQRDYGDQNNAKIIRLEGENASVRMKQTGTWNPTLDEPEMDVEKFILFFFVPKFFWEISTIYLPNVVVPFLLAVF